MFGARYLETRQRLGKVVADIRRLGERNDTDISQLVEEQDYLRKLHSPLLFVVCGEVNAGKSTFLNGLFGQDLCKANVLPETDRVHWYRWGEQDENSDVTPTLQERYRRIDFLKDYNIVDTPGTNSVKRGHEAITKRFLPVADLLLFVFPINNPWGAATWNFICELDPSLHQNLILILQQTDQRSEKDIPVVLNHMATLAEKKIGIRPPIFPVSAKWAVEARQQQPFGQKLWQASGYHELGLYLSRHVTSNPVRQRVLREVHDSARLTLRNIEKRIEEEAVHLERNMAFLRELESEVHQTRDARASLFSRKFSGLEDVFTDTCHAKTRELARRVAPLQSILSLFRRENLPAQIEQSLIEANKEAVESRAAHDADELVAQCRQHWQSVAPRIRERLSITPPDFDQETAALADTRDRFVQRMGRAAREAIVKLKIRGLLDLHLESRRITTRRLVSASLICIIAAGLFGAMQLFIWPFAALGLALAFLILAAIHSHRSGQEINGFYSEKIEQSRKEFTDALANDYRDGVRDFFIEYSRLFENIRRHVAQQKLALKPQLEEWNNHFLELKGIEQDL
ncbi:MAG: dynamin family protein [Verrucomicrobiales bacterium]